MASYNRVILVGNLTREPDYKQLGSGQAVCRLGLAVNRQFKNRQTNTMVQEVCYIDIDVWGAQAESCRQYLQKGRPVLIEGRLKLDTWEAEGQKKSKHSVVADRVTFLASGATSINEADANADMSAENSVHPSTISSDVEKDLFDQIDRLKAKVAPAKKKASPAQQAPEMEFNDQPPFENSFDSQLPF